MANYLLCSRPLAEVPFHIESVHLNVYSAEELCYFLSNNLALAPEVLEDPLLSWWLAEQCGWKEKIREFDALSPEAGKISEKLSWIFVKSHYFSESQFRVLKTQMEELDADTPVLRQKAKGDALIRNRKYMRCISCYAQIFNTDGIQEQPPHFRAIVYNNMGCAYARLFQGARAAECFRKAYEEENDALFLERWLKALYLEGGSEAMREAAKKQKISPEVTDRIRRQIDTVRSAPIPMDSKGTLRNWIREYHVSVDQ